VQGLPPILVINLDRDPDRLAHITRECVRHGLVFTRVAGILGDEVPTELRPNFFDEGDAKSSLLKRGEIGCYASHLAIYRRMIAGEFGPAVLVLEDDIEIAEGFGEILVATMKALPENWDIVRLSNVPKRAYVPLSPLPRGRDLVRYSKIPNSTGAYLISVAGARKLVGPRRRARAIDEDLRYAYESDLSTYGVVPVPVTPDVLTSTIDALEAGRLDKRLRQTVRVKERARPQQTLQRVVFNMRELGPGRWLACAFVNGLERVGKRLGRPSPLAASARWLAR
jgi:glycosyl transferase family 25